MAKKHSCFVSQPIYILYSPMIVFYNQEEKNDCISLRGLSG